MTCTQCGSNSMTYHPMGIIECMDCRHTIQLEITPRKARAPDDDWAPGGYSAGKPSPRPTQEGHRHGRQRSAGKPALRGT